MLLNRLFVENFGLFKGRHDFDFAPRSVGGTTKPIILVGGMNGAGKTTLLEAIQLALYGRLSLGDRVRQTDYEDHIRGRIHRPRNGEPRPSGSCLGVEFEFSAMGTRHVYEITRKWNIGHGASLAVQEDLAVKQDGQPLDDVEVQHWQEFVTDLIPPGLSQLFFFDGEKIQRLADEDDSLVLVDSIKSLLGLDLAERLEADLRIFRDRSLKQQERDFGQAIPLAVDEVDALQQRLGGLRDRQSDLNTTLDGVACSIRQQEQKLSYLGARFTDDRSQLKERRAALQLEISLLEKRIRELTEGVLPFAFCPILCCQLVTQLESEAAAIKEQAFNERGTMVFKRVQDRLNTEEFGQNGTAKVRDVVLALLEQEFVREAHPVEGKILHGHSDETRLRMKSWFALALGDTSRDLKSLAGQLESATRALQQVEVRLQQIPEDDTLKPVVQDLSVVIQRQLKIQQQKQAVDTEVDSVVRSLEQARRNLERVRDHADKADRQNSRIELLERSRKALQSYRDRLLGAKVTQLEEEVTTCFRTLMRKEDLIHRISIGAVDFSVTLYDRDGNALKKSELSAGEKQLYAVAVLWGLGRASGRPLPLIIDTPLGRLDSQHRAHLVERYFPHAAHQVIILSTDTEIDQRYCDVLTPWVSHAYHLEYDPTSTSTWPREGYFWKEKLAYEPA